MALRKIRGKVINQAIASHTGKDGDLFFDDSTNSFKISDGATAGCVSIINSPTGIMGASLTAKVQLANGFNDGLTANTHVLTAANGNAVTATLPTAANSSLGDVIIIEYHVKGSNGQTMKIGTAGEFYMPKSAIYKPVGATSSLVGLNYAVDIADGTADDFANLVGLNNAGPGVGSYVICTFNGSVWRLEARLTSSGTSVVNGTSVFAQS